MSDFRMIPLEQITPSKTNPRQRFDITKLAELAESIKAKGVLQPILVRPKVGGPDRSQPLTIVCTVTTAGHLKAAGIYTFGDLIARAAAKFPEKFETDLPAAIHAAAKAVPNIQAFEAKQLADLFPKKGSTPLSYELVAGERRHRAALIAELTAIPAFVRELSDLDVLECQVIENDQREDTLPSERAAGYQAMLDAGVSIEDLAKKVGKSPSWIRGVLRLGRLPDKIMAAVDAGELPRSTAELVARVPSEFHRNRLAECLLNRQLVRTPEDFNDPKYKITRSRWFDEDGPLTYQQVKEMIEECCQVELKAAPFDRKSLTLLAEAGSCEECPKRAGNDPELVKAGTRADMCTDPACYKRKVEAWQKQVAAAAKADGLKVLSAKDCEQVFGRGSLNGSVLASGAPYLDLADQCHGDTAKKKRSYKQLVGEELADQVVVGFDRTGQKRYLVPKEAALPVLKKKGIKAEATSSYTPTGMARRTKTAAEKAQEAKRREENRVHRAVVKEVLAEASASAESLFNAVMSVQSQASSSPQTELLRAIAANKLQNLWGSTLEDVCAARGMKGTNVELKNRLKAAVMIMPGPQIVGLLAELLAAPECNGWYSDRKTGILKTLAVDKKQIEKRVKAELKKTAAKKAVPA